MSRLRDLADQIVYAAVRMMVESGYRLTFPEAQRKAAKQFATVEKLKPRQVRVNTKRNSIDDGFDAGDDPRRILLAKLAQMAARIGRKTPEKQLTPEPAVRAVSAEPLGQPTSEPKSGVLARLIGSATGGKSGDEPGNANPEPTQPYNYQFVYSGRSHIGLLDDSQFPIRFRDQTTANWRRCIEENKRRRNQPPNHDGEFKFSSLNDILAELDRQKRERGETR